MRLALLLLLTLPLAACDSADADGLRLDGTYTGEAQSPIATDTDPGFVQLDLALTFDDAGPGTSPVAMTATSTAFGSPPEQFQGTGQATLAAAGAFGLDATLTDGDGVTLRVTADGTATPTTISVTLGGTLPADGVVLRR